MKNKYQSTVSYAGAHKAAHYLYNKFGSEADVPTHFTAKVKLHGTHADIVFDRDTEEILCQSRNNVISVGSDNAGFAYFVHNDKESWYDVFSSVINYTPNAKIITISGEWAGKGIQDTEAVTKIGDKYFFVVGITLSYDDGSETEITDSKFIADMMDSLPSNVKVIPEYCFPNECAVIVTKWNSADHVKEFTDTINKCVESIGIKDPYIFEEFGVEGQGEGLVFFPVSEDRDVHRKFRFKAKSSAHTGKLSKKPASPKAVTYPEVSTFAKMVCSEKRLIQGVDETESSDYDIKSLGKFIGWVCKDIVKEIEQGDIDLPDGKEWKSVSKEIANVARRWYVSHDIMNN